MSETTVVETAAIEVLTWLAKHSPSHEIKLSAASRLLDYANDASWAETRRQAGA